MTTKELIQWGMAAEKARENSWDDSKNNYKLSILEAVLATKPEKATEVEKDIVTCLVYNCWNEIQDWSAQTA